ncbi:MAG: 23S rRNA (pseudouridine(1915)-N(3))-methyltransferase RlmH [Clostridia bacterium]|nr:23S rRNA (pseudouridine(1915)-N(3))-methyltransferase RlmH [Clostridia bacterium]
MNITIIAVGKIKEKYFQDAVAEYKKRISRFGRIEIIEIPDEKIPDNAKAAVKEKIKEKEGAAIMSHIKSGTYLIALCIEGKELSSEEFAENIAKLSMQTGHITFAIGGSLGLSDSVKNASAQKVSFGKITLPHQLARVVLSEQIYRAFKINSNEAYHK